MKYPPYPKYKDSGVEWIGEIPEGWQSVQLKRTCELTTGFTPDSTEPDNFSGEENEFPWVRPEDLDVSSSLVGATKFLSQRAWDGLRAVEAPAVLICCIGTIGKIGYATMRLTTNQQLTAVSFGHKVHPRFGYYSLIAARPQMELASTGNVLRILNSERLGRIWLPCMEISEQVRLAAFLDREIAKIDTLVRDYEDLISLLTEKRQALISHAVTQGLSELVDANDAEFGEWCKPVRFRDSGVEWLGEFPEGWACLYLKFVCDVRDGTHSTPEYVEEGPDTFRFVTSKDLSGGHLDLEDTKVISGVNHREYAKRSRVQRHDILMPMIGTVGGASIVDTDEEFSVKNVAIFKSSPKCNPTWLCSCLDSNMVTTQFDRLSSGGVQSFVGLETLRGLRLICPPLEAQSAIAAFLTRETTKIDTLVRETQDAIELLKEHRSALITAAVTGKINVEGRV